MAQTIYHGPDKRNHLLPFFIFNILPQLFLNFIMSIKLKVVEKTQPGVKGGGQVRYAAAVTDTRLIGEREFIEKVSQKYHISTADIVRVLNSVSETMNSSLADGDSVAIYQMGIFSTSVSSSMKDTPLELKQTGIKKININFRPCSWLKREVSDYNYKLTGWKKK